MGTYSERRVVQTLDHSTTPGYMKSTLRTRGPMARLVINEAAVNMTTVYRFVDSSLDKRDKASTGDSCQTRPSSGASVAELCDWSPASLNGRQQHHPHQQQQLTPTSPTRPSSRTCPRTVKEMLSSSGPATPDPRLPATWSGRMFLAAKSDSLTKGERQIISGICQNRGKSLGQKNNGDVERLLRLHRVASHRDAWLMGRAGAAAVATPSHQDRDSPRPYLRQNSPLEGRILSARLSISSPRFTHDRPRLICKQCMPCSRPPTAKHRPGYHQDSATITAPPSSPETEMASAFDVGLDSQRRENEVLEGEIKQSEAEQKTNVEKVEHETVGKDKDESKGEPLITDKDSREAPTQNSYSVLEILPVKITPPTEGSNGEQREVVSTVKHDLNARVPSGPKVKRTPALRPKPPLKQQMSSEAGLPSLIISKSIPKLTNKSGCKPTEPEKEAGAPTVQDSRDSDCSTSRTVLNIYLPSLSHIDQSSKTRWEEMQFKKGDARVETNDGVPSYPAFSRSRDGSHESIASSSSTCSGSLHSSLINYSDR